MKSIKINKTPSCTDISTAFKAEFLLPHQRQVSSAGKKKEGTRAEHPLGWEAELDVLGAAFTINTAAALFWLFNILFGFCVLHFMLI